MKIIWYILIEKIPFPVNDIIEYSMWYKNHEPECVVGKTHLNGIEISTVFLGFDQSLGNSTKPDLFETMIFGGEHDGFKKRYATWIGAEAGHKKAEELVRTKITSNDGS